MSERTLDEVARECLRFLRVSDMDRSGAVFSIVRWHLSQVCARAAEAKGWTWVKSHEWWPEAEGIVFSEKVRSKSL